MKAVLFDYNGVLVDDLELHKQAYLELARRHHSKTTPQQLRTILGTTPSLAKIELIAGTRDPKVTGPLLKEKEDIYIELAQNGVLFPSVERVLESLSQHYRLALITNSTRRQLKEVFPRRLLEKFKTLITYEDIEKPKPDPQSLREALKELWVTKQEACFVGDTPSDMEAAARAGIMAIGIPTGLHSRQQLLEAGADLVVDSLDDLEKALSTAHKSPQK